MNNEYIKVGEGKYVVSNENGKIDYRLVKSPELFKYENDVEIVDNEIKGLKTERKNIIKNLKIKNLRRLCLYLPVLALWSTVFIKDAINALFISSYANTFGEISSIIISVILVSITGGVISDTVASNIQTQNRKKEIDGSLLIAKDIKKEAERQLDNFKARSIVNIKDNTKTNEIISLKERNNSKRTEILKRITYYNDEYEYDEEYEDNYDKGHTLTKKR